MPSPPVRAYSDYETFDTGEGTSGSADGDRFSGSLTAWRTFVFDNGFDVTPEASIMAGTEKISGLADLLASPATVDDADFFNARLGSEVGYRFGADSRIYGLAFAEFTDTSGDGAATYLSTGYQSEDWSATLGGGLDLALSDHTRFGMEGRVRGLGSDTLIYGGSARLSVSF